MYVCFEVTNDNRSDTFPETPFHIRVIPSNDQAPIFKDSKINLKIMQSGTLTLPRDLFEVEDPDTAIDNLIFAIDKAPDNFILELRTKGQNHVLNKGKVVSAFMSVLSFLMMNVSNDCFR